MLGHSRSNVRIGAHSSDCYMLSVHIYCVHALTIATMQHVYHITLIKKTLQTYLGLDDSADGHSLEAQQEPVVDSEAILDLALLLEAEVSAHSAALVVASDEKDLVRVLELEGQQVQYDLTAEGTSVNVVPQEEQVVVRAPLLEDVEQVKVLAVDVAYYHHWGVHFHYILQWVAAVFAAAAAFAAVVIVLIVIALDSSSINGSSSSGTSSGSIASHICMQSALVVLAAVLTVHNLSH